MVNYEYGKIYKITSKSTGLIYYGSTAQYYLSKRLSGHVRNYKRYLNGKHHYVSSFKLLECDDYNIQLIKNFPSANKKQLITEEGKYIRENECVNKMIPGRTKKEYYEDNQEKMKQHREDNKEKIKQYYEDNKEYIKEKVKQYKEDNKEKIKQHREDNKEKIKERKSKPYECACGSIVKWNDKARHFKTKKHCEYINNL